MNKCPLCGNQKFVEGKPCDICGSSDERFLFFRIGYIYKKEAAEVKLILGLGIALLVIAFTVVFAYLFKFGIF